MKTKEQIGLELELLGDYLGAILYTETTKMIALMKAFGFQQELEEGEHDYFCKHIEEYLFTVRNHFQEIGYFSDSEISDEEIKEVVKNGVYHVNGECLARQIRDEFIKMGKSERCCPVCQQQPKINITGLFFQNVHIHCNCDYLNYDQNGD